MQSSFNARPNIALPTLVLITAILSLFLMNGPDQTPSGPVVPVDFAEKRGAENWKPARKNQFVEDEDNQWPLTDGEIRARGSRAPFKWLPETDQCRYISQFMKIMQKYGLDNRPEEMYRLRSLRQQCYTQFQ